MNNKKNKNKQLIFMILLSVVILSVVNFFNSEIFTSKNISYTQFETMVESNEVKTIKYRESDNHIYVIDNNGNVFKTDNPDYSDFKKEHLSKGITFEALTTPTLRGSIETIIRFAFLSILLTMLFATLSSTDRLTGSSNKQLEDGKIPKVKFDDISGLDDVKQDLKLAVEYLKNPQEFTAIGAKMPTGMVFYGSPGTGKTMLAKAIAGEAGVPFFHKSGSDFVELFAGKGAKTVRDLFAEARKNAPCILFIDEIDAVGKKRGNGLSGNDEREQTLNELLNQLDGFENNEGILVISATNRLETLDEALIRPGRFGKHVRIPKPRNAKERLSILKIHGSNKKVSEETLNYIADITRGFSGAELENLLNEGALLQKLEKKSEIDLDLIDKAYFKIATKGSKIPSKERDSLDNKIVAWHEAGHTLASKLFKQDFYQVTISGSTSGVGGATFTDLEEDRMLKTMRDLEEKIQTLYAGRVAESLILGDNITVGASNDIMVASNLIKDMISQYGMSRDNCMINFEVISDPKLIAMEASEISKKLYSNIEKLLTENKAILEEIANDLIEKETLYEIDVDRILYKYENTKDLINKEKFFIEESNNNEEVNIEEINNEIKDDELTIDKQNSENEK